MPLTVVSGLPGSPRQTRLIERVLERAAGATALVALPTAAEVSAARLLVAAGTPVGVRVATLDGVVQNQWALRGDGRALVEDLAGDVLAARALVRAGIHDRPGRGAVALLRAVASRQAAVGGRVPAAAGLSGRLLEALRVYRTSLAEAALIERSEAVRLLCDAPAPASAVGITGFRSFDPAAEALIAAWAVKNDVVIELPWVPGNHASEACEALVERLRRSTDVEIVDAGPPSDGRPAELIRIATGLFTGPQPAAGEGAVRLGLAQGDEEEALLLADMALDVIDRGDPPGDITIAFPDLPRHRGWMEHALRERGVPAAVDLDVAVMETAFGRALLRLWDFLDRGMRREDLLAFLRSGFAGVSLSAADAADRRAREGRTIQGLDVLVLAGGARGLIESCKPLARTSVTSENGRKWKSLADRLLANAHGDDSPRLQSDARPDAAAHRLFCGLIQQAVELRGVPVGPGELMEAFASARVRVPADRCADAVLVTTLDRLSRTPVDHALIGGLTAGEVPRRGTEERLQGEAVASVVAMLGVDPDPGERARLERLRFYAATTAARRSLALVRREADDEGAPLRASVFWDEFLDLYRDPRAEEWPATAPRIQRRDEKEQRRGAPRQRRGVLTHQVEDQEAEPCAVSASSLEAYAACPYRWFIERRLAPRAPDVTFDRMAAGSLAHATLAAFHGRLREHFDRVTPQNVEWALRVARECFDAAATSAPRPEGLAERRLRADVWPAVERVVCGDATFLPGFAPAHSEWAFGLDGDGPEVLGAASVKGRADRIDIGPAGIVVIDYKLSTAHPLDKIEKRRLLQLQLYAAAASRRLGLPVVGGLYRSLKTGESRGFILRDHGEGFTSTDRVDPERLRQILDDAVGLATEAAQGMRAGNIEPRPDRDACAFCSAAAFCGQAVT